MLLAQMVVEYVADITKLVSGVQSATKSMNNMQSAASASTSSLTSSFKGATASIQALTKKAESAGLNVSKLASLQLKAGESASRLSVAQASAALALKKADDMALAGTASAQQIAVAQARAALAADHVKVAEDAAANAMAKVDAESKKLSEALQDATSKSSLLARGADALKGSLESMGEQAKAITAVGLTIAAGGALALGGALASTVGPAKDFQATMLKVNALAGLSKKEVDAASDAILRMAGRVGKGPQDLAEGLYYVASAGYDAKTSMEILEVSAKAASVGMTSTQNVANALTAALAIFPGMEVAEAIDMMTKTVSTGKTEWEDYAVVVGKMAKNASNAGIAFEEVNAAFAVMTNTMPSSEQAADALNALLQTSSRFSLLTDRAEKLNLTFDISKYKTLDLAGRVAYLSEVTNGNTESMTTMLGQENAVIAATTIAAEGAADYTKALDGITNSSGAANSAFSTVAAGAQASWDKAKGSLESLQIKIGNALIPAVTAFTDEVAPLIGKMIEWAEENHIVENATNAISGALTSASKEMSKFVDVGTRVVTFFRENEGAMAAFQITGAMLAATFTAIAIAATAAAIAEAAAAWPILLVVAAVAGLTAAFVYFYNNVKPFRDFMDALGVVFMKVWAVVVEQFTPAWNELSIAFKKIQPALEVVGKILGGVLLVAIGLVFAAVVALAMGLAASIGGIVRVFTGMVEIVSGVLDVLGGVFLLVMDLITFRFDQLGGDLARIGGGFVQIFKGLWDVIAGLFLTAAGVIGGILVGFCQGIVGFFQGLWDTLVGHSIIPDMINAIIAWFAKLPVEVGAHIQSMYNTAIAKLNELLTAAQTKASEIINGIIAWFQQLPGTVGAHIQSMYNTAIAKLNELLTAAQTKASEIVNGIIAWFQQLPGRAGAAISSMSATVVNALNGLAASAYQCGLNIVNNIANGIRAGIGAVGSAINAVTQYIADHLPKSPAKMGPLKDLAKQGNEISNQIAAGIHTGIPQVQSAIQNMSSDVVSTLNGLASSVPSPASNTVNGIMDWLKLLPERARDTIQSMVNTIVSTLNGLASSASQSGANITNMIADGIRSAMGSVKSAIAALTQYISDHLPKSPAKMGPLMHLANQGTEISNQISKGMIAGIPLVRTAINHVVEPVGINLKGVESTPIQSLAKSPLQGASSKEDIHVHVYWDGRDITDKIQTRVLKESRRGPIRA
jgi:TP901 family phage tail tape measure protein